MADDATTGSSARAGFRLIGRRTAGCATVPAALISGGDFQVGGPGHRADALSVAETAGLRSNVARLCDHR
jgi:hypothetical protein